MRTLLAGSAVSGDAAQMLDQDRVAEVLVAHDGDVPVGFAIFFDLPEIVFARRCGALDDLFVCPASRGRGIARALIAELAALDRTRSWSHLRWIVPPGDVAAIALYDRIAERVGWMSYVIRLDPGGSL